MAIDFSGFDYSQETQEFIQELVDNSYAIEDCIEFIQEHGENNFRKHYEKYVEIGESRAYGYEAADAFIAALGIEDIDNFSDYYFGSNYHNEAEFAELYYEEVNSDIINNIPSAIRSAIDWQHVWDSWLSDDFILQGSYAFRRTI